MSEQINSVDFWVEELTHDINPEHFNHHENFIPYMHDEKINSFGDWMWNNGYNVGLANLQVKVNTYCVPQWISVKDRLPEEDDFYLVYIVANANPKNKQIITLYFSNLSKRFIYGSDEIFTVTHWMPLPQKPESEDDAEDGCMKETIEGEWIVHYNDIFPIESTEECSICHAEQYINGNDDNYCPNCGVKMKQT